MGTEADKSAPCTEVVGVVGDMKQSFDAGSKAEMFVPYGQYPDPILAGMYLNTALVVRTAGNPADVTTSVRAVIAEIDPGQPLVNVRTMETAMSGTVAQPRFQMTLLVLFAVVAVTLSAVGVYGVMAYTVSQRVPELGVRMAIGASPAQVVRMVVRQGALLTSIGIVLAVAALLASYVPARRAARISPLAALGR